MNTNTAVLSRRELEIESLLLQGYGVKSLADMLGVSIKTVAAHADKLYRKRGVNSRYELMAQFMQAPLPQPGESFIEGGHTWELYEYATDRDGVPHAVVIESDCDPDGPASPSRTMSIEDVKLALRR